MEDKIKTCKACFKQVKLTDESLVDDRYICPDCGFVGTLEDDTEEFDRAKIEEILAEKNWSESWKKIRSSLKKLTDN